MKKQSFQKDLDKLKLPLQLSPQDILDAVDQYPKFFKSEITQIDDNTVYDIKLAIRSYQEDDLFVSNEAVWINFRRGLSLVRHQDQLQILRKGLRKFFDLDYSQISGKATSVTDIDRQLHQYTLGEVFQAFKSDIPIKVYASEKLNGKNAQITYYNSYWVICSKNVSLLCKEAQDLKGTEPSVVLQIAQLWFKLIEGHKKLEQLKQGLKNNTLVGEMCGDTLSQHCIKYAEPHLKFYAVVKNVSQEPCRHPNEARKFINSMGLPLAAQTEYLTKNKQDFVELINTIYKEISMKSMEEAGEGVVLYFCEEEGKCLSLAKLKTIDYRLERKLREKLRLCVAGNKTAVSLFGRYKEEVLEMVADLQIERDYSKNIEEAKIAFQFCWNFGKSNPDKEQQKKANLLIQEQYCDFRELLKKNLERTKEDIIGEWIKQQ